MCTHMKTGHYFKITRISMWWLLGSVVVHVASQLKWLFLVSDLNVGWIIHCGHFDFIGLCAIRSSPKACSE